MRNQILARINKGEIAVKPWAWTFGCVDCTITSRCLTPNSFCISVAESAWDDYHTEAVVNELYRLCLSGEITFSFSADNEGDI